MTTHFQLTDEFPQISLDLFEKYLNHPELNKMLSKMPAFRSRELVEEKKLEDGEITWKFKVVAGGDIPSSVKRVVNPEMFTWWETSHFVPKEHCIHFTIKPVTKLVKFEGKGNWQLKKHGKGTKRVIEGEMTVKIPLVGKLVEGFLIKELKRNYEVEPDIQTEFYLKMKQKDK